eukprot:scaffold2304_cov134-Isochrysis_galbana.AAC.3
MRGRLRPGPGRGKYDGFSRTHEDISSDASHSFPPMLPAISAAEGWRRCMESEHSDGSDSSATSQS